RAETQVHTLDAGGVDPDLVARTRRRKIRDQPRIDLHSQDGRGRRAVVDTEAIGIRTQRGPDDGQQRSQDAVLIEAGNRGQVGFDVVDMADVAVTYSLRLAGQLRAEPGLEQFDELAGDGRILDERLLD